MRLAALDGIALDGEACGGFRPNVGPGRGVFASPRGGAAVGVPRAWGGRRARARGERSWRKIGAGPGSSMAGQRWARSAPGGYRIGRGRPASISVNPGLNPKLNYKP